MQVSIEKYAELYRLQDEVLSALSDHFGPFCLTGSAALSRFYLNHRMAFDLDFSVNLLPCFLKKASPVVDRLKTQFLVGENDTDIFPRIVVLWIRGRDHLRISLSNDISDQLGLPLMAGHIPVDNMRNMLVKKLKTILERDDPKDLFDIMSIASAYAFQWDEILMLAQKKSIMAQVNLLLQFSRLVTRFNRIARARTPGDLFGMLGIPSPVAFDRVYLAAFLERKGTRSEKNSTTPEVLSTELLQTASELKSLSEQDDFLMGQEIPGLRTCFRFELGGACISIVVKPVDVRKKALEQLGRITPEQFQGVGWMNSSYQADDLMVRFERIRNDIHKGRVNALGVDKTPIDKARPGLGPRLDSSP